MNILLVFNYYQQPGGEEQVFAAEGSLLEARGHRVLRYSMRNDDIDGMNRFGLAGKVLWNPTAYREIGKLVRENAVDVVHFHNTFPLISPAAYYAAKRAGARVVQTLHNYRLLCPNALLSREGRLCEQCLGRRVPWQGVRHACYRGSRTQSASVAAMLSLHHAVGTWTRRVDRYIALSEFAKQKFIEGGLPARKIAVKANFVDPDPGTAESRGNYALFAGRLSAEKGITTLLNAWRSPKSELLLRIVGDGPLSEDVRKAAEQPDSNIEYLGRKPRTEVLDLMKGAMCLVFPSTWFEGFPMTIAEAYATGLPVLSSGLGTMASIVKTGVTGLHFTPGDAESLASCVRWLAQHPEKAKIFAQNARHEYLARYTAAGSYRRLMSIYRDAIESPSAATVMTADQVVTGDAR